MQFERLIPILVPTVFVSFLVLERLFPAKPLPKVRGWLFKCFIFFLVIGAANALIPALIAVTTRNIVVVDIRPLGTVGQALLMLLVIDQIGYWIHRGMHNSQIIWRWTHQMHHSAERMDIAGSAYFHPFDFIPHSVLPSAFFVALCNVTPLAAAIGGFIAYILGAVPHLNMRTPRSLGYCFQRPEMHAIHHQRGVHAYNYGMLVLSDLLYGTWRNPATFPETLSGFWDGASALVGSMLIGRDIGSSPPSRVLTDREQSAIG